MDLDFAAFLEEYVPVMPQSMQNGVLHRMTYSENLIKISLYVEFPILVPMQDIFSLEHELEVRLEIQAVRIYPHYDENCFTMAYFPDLVLFLKREMTVVNGFIDGAETAYHDGILEIHLKNGGYDILEKYHVADFFSHMLEQMFLKHISVQMHGTTSMPEEDFQAMLARAEATFAETNGTADSKNEWWHEWKNGNAEIYGEKCETTGGNRWNRAGQCCYDSRQRNSGYADFYTRSSGNTGTACDYHGRCVRNGGTRRSWREKDFDLSSDRWDVFCFGEGVRHNSEYRKISL